MDKNQILQFLEQQRFMVISTVSEKAEPESALVGFGQTENLEIIFGTSKVSLKAKNLSQNPKVAIVIGWDGSGNLQYEGEARLLTGEENEKYADIYYAKHPAATKFRNDPREQHYLITPKWLRFNYVKNDEIVSSELTF